MSRKKPVYLIVIILPIIFIATAVSVLFWWKSSISSVSSDETSTRFVIQKGWGASQIANKLEEQNLIKSSLAFKVYVQLTSNSSKIKAGEYDLSKNLSLESLVAKLLKGPNLLWVTVPEGLRREEIIQRFANGLDKDQDYVDEFLLLSKNDEGYLFPDTYLVPKDITAQKTYQLLLSTFEQKTKDLLPAKDGLTDRQVVILASLIERETRSDSERPVVAGIILNRLNASWPLQVDATLQYTITNEKLKNKNSKVDTYWGDITKADLEINSPYNTYKSTGLPPTPICSPGLLSLEAAANPQTSDYWFYLHGADGQIHYAKTLEEHNANVRKYLNK
jgi:UPF0755 protein